MNYELKTKRSSLLSITMPPGKRLGRGIWIGFTVFLLLLFGLSDVLILLFSKWPNLYGAVGVPVQKWEEIVIYTPFARAFSLSNLFPIAPAFDQSLSGFSVYPWITFFIEAMLLKVFALGNINAYMLINHSVLPVLNFWLIYLIFNHYISKVWAILLAFFGVTYFSGFHYINSVETLLGFGDNAGSIFHYGLPEITRTPFPSISLLLLLIPFYLTIRSNRLMPYRLTFLSLIWGLQIYVYLINFIAGAIFFSLWIVYAHYITDKGFYPSKTAVSIGVFLLICIALGIPYYAVSISFLGEQLAGKVASPVRGVLSGSDWNVFFSYSLPFSLLAVSFYLFRSDYYELFYRYSPVFIVLVVDLLIGCLLFLVTDRINPELYYYRISNILFRFFYFIPFLYFVGLPRKRGCTPKKSSFYRIVHNKLPDLLRNYIHRYRKVYSISAILLLGIYILMNNVYIYKMHEKLVMPEMQQIQQELDMVKQAGIKDGSIAVYEDITANLLTPAVNNTATLLVSSFGNFVDDRLILERIILYAKLFGWSEDRLLAFMEPSETFIGLTSYKNKELIITNEMLESGLGYWLLNHKKPINQQHLEPYRQRILHLYRETNLDQLLKRNSVGVILVRNPELYPLECFRQEAVGNYTLIYPSNQNF